MGSAVAVILLRERHVVEAFERAGATSPERARSPADLAVGTDSTGWRRLRERAVVRESAPASGRYYVDLDVWRALRRMRRRIVTVLIVAAVAFWIVITLGVGAVSL